LLNDSNVKLLKNMLTGHFFGEMSINHVDHFNQVVWGFLIFVELCKISS
jgi:hypothetical protein